MNERLNKADLIDKVSEILADKRFVRGGNRKSWISKYHLNYAKEDVIKPVLSACFDAIVNAIEIIAINLHTLVITFLLLFFFILFLLTSLFINIIS